MTIKNISAILQIKKGGVMGKPIILDEGLHREIKAKAAVAGVSIQSFVKALLMKALKKGG